MSTAPPHLRKLCECPECKGEGHIPCPECDGDGHYAYANLADAVIPKGIPHEDELHRLRDDARRVNDQAKRLTALIPAAAASYEAQRKATIFAIESEAEQLLKPMSTAPNKVLVICCRVATAGRIVPGSTRETCMDCQQAVWLSPGTAADLLAHLTPAECICTGCAAARHLKEPLHVFPPGPGVLAELRQALHAPPFTLHRPPA